MEQQPVILEVNPKENTVLNRRLFPGALLAIGTAGMGAILAVPVLGYVLYPLYVKSGKNISTSIGEMTAFSNL